MYEPWHLRYVGVENAMLLHEANYTLAYKPAYYKTSSLTKLLSTLKQKFGFNKSVEIGG
jgi:HEPN domain-containing protein